MRRIQIPSLLAAGLALLLPAARRPRHEAATRSSPQTGLRLHNVAAQPATLDGQEGPASSRWLARGLIRTSRSSSR